MNGWRIHVLFKCEEWGIAVDGGTYSAQRAFGVLPHVSGCHCACSACDSAGAPDPRCNELWDRLDSAGLRPPTLARPALVRRSGATDERLVARLAEYLPPGPALS